MMKNKKIKVNDVSFEKWVLAPEGHDVIDRCQTRIMEAKYETQGLSSLFRNMENCEMDPGDFYGISITLERISRRLAKTLDKLGIAIVKDDSKIC